MCLIYYRNSEQHGAPIDLDSLEAAFYGNPDGAGLAWYRNGAWHVWRSIDAPWRHVAKRLRLLDEFGVERIIAHFRYATHGGATLENCHPFQVAPQSFLFHNGTFAGVDERDDMSDTRQVAEKLSAAAARGALRPAWHLAKLLANGNRLLLTLPHGRMARAGTWRKCRDGMYSNGDCLWRREVACDLRDEFSQDDFASWYHDHC